MTIPYKDILLWGHSLQDFREMFALSDAELKASILDCCGGPDSFNVELTAQGGKVISCDPLFDLNKADITHCINDVFAEMLTLVEAHKERFAWDKVASPEALAIERKKNIALFLNDYEQGKKEGRYQAADLPNLPYKAAEFDLALCSHYFFANCPDQSLEFQVAAIKNLCHVAKEVRIFPLVDSQGEIPTIVGPIMQALYQADLGLEFKAVPYQFQKKGNAMLRVWGQVCSI